MRTIDADALKELFSEVIGHIAKKPEMNGNLEHMIRASAMVIQMIDDAPTVQPDTTTHDSIPAETGKNDGDGTSGDCISRQQAIEVLRNRWLKTRNYDGIGEDIAEECEIYLKTLPSVQPEHCGDAVSRNAIVQKLNEMDRYVSTELRLCDTDKKFPQNEVFIVDDVYEEIVERLPSVQPTLYGYNIEHLELIARVLQKEDLPPERVVEALTDIGRIVAIVKDEFDETLRKAVEDATNRCG